MHDSLKDDYNLDALARVRPVGDGFDLFVTPRFGPVYANGYEVLSTRIVKQFAARKDLFIDVGAHYGYYTLLAAEANPGIRTVSVEPIEDNLRVLRKNLDLNGLGSDRAITLRAAVSARAGRASFCKSEASDNSSMYPHPSSETLARIEVDTVCLDDVVGAHPSARIFVKTDTDGHELEVLKGFSKTLDAGVDVTILMEMNPKMMKIAGTGTPEILAFLQARDFRVFAIDDQEARFYPMDQAVNVARMEARYAKSYYNVLCVRKTAALSVLFFSHAANLTGAERSLLDLIRGLSERGVLCTAVLPAPGPLRAALVNAGCAVHVLADGHFPPEGWRWADSGPGISPGKLAGFCDVAMNSLLPEIRKTAPDVVFSQTIVSPWGALCAETLELPHVLSAREYGELDYGMTFSLGFRKSMEALYRSSAAVFCITSDVKQALFDGDVDGKIEVVYSSIRARDVLARAPAASSTGAAWKPDPAMPTVGIFGAISPGKGQSDLVRACLEMARRGMACRCLLAGSVIDADYAQTLRQEIEASGFSERFIWSGFVDDPYALMGQVDVLVSCSQKEALGRTLIEAALLGRPIVYADSGGPREVFSSGEHGLAYEPGDFQGLALALESALRDRAASAARAQRAKDYVLRRFSDETYVGTIFARLKRIAGPERARRQPPAVAGLLMEAGIGVISTSRIQPKLLYADEGAEFSENRAVLAPEIPFGPFEIAFQLPDGGYPRLRFDPTELYAVELVLYSVGFTAEDGALLDADQADIEANGESVGKHSWKFRTLDPQVVMRLGKKTARVQIVGEVAKVSSRQILQEIDAACRSRESKPDGFLDETETVDSSVFIDDGAGYGEENKVLARMAVDPKTHAFSVEFRFPPGGCAERKIRWDPCEGHFCRCRIEKVETDGVYRGIARRNAWKSEDGWDEFMTGDPVYELDGDWGPATFIRMSGEFILPGADEVAARFMEELAEVRRECNAQCTAQRQEVCQGEGTLDALRRQFDDQQQELVRIQSSRIWRWTRFIRLAGSWLGTHSATSASQKP